MCTIHSEGSPIAQRRRPKLPNVRFGTDENQVRHTFRHTDRLGLDRDAISTQFGPILHDRDRFRLEQTLPEVSVSAE